MRRVTPDSVMAVADRLTATQREILGLLSWLPFAPVDVLTRLLGMQGPAEVYRVLGRLEAQDLIGRITPPLDAGHNPRLAYLTKLGVAVVAHDLAVAPMALARERRLRRGDLLRQLPHLPHDLALYRLLAAISLSGPDPPQLAGWRAPWRLRYQRPKGERALMVSIPACARLRWGEVDSTYLLIADLGSLPLRRYSRLLQGLVTGRHVQGGGLPLVVVGAEGQGRAAAWRQLLVEAGRSQRDSPLAGQVVTWAQVARGAVEVSRVAGPPCRERVSPVYAERLLVRPDDDKAWRRSLRSLPTTLIVEKLRAENLLAALALTLSAVDRELLDVVACHPFLSAADVAEIMDWTAPWAARQCDRLVALGALRRLTADEVGARAAVGGWLEVTRVGLRLLAEQVGMTLSEAVRWLGYVGGGPEPAVEVRRKLVQVLAHTLGVNGVFVGFYRAARQARAAGRDERLVVWRSAAQCSQGSFRPDGYGVYTVNGRRHSFWLEYDRGTMWRQAIRVKFEAYAEHVERRAHRQGRATAPTLLIVTQRAVDEARLVDVIRSVGLDETTSFAIWLTTEVYIHDPANTDGMRGPVWRRIGDEANARCAWP